MPKLNLKEVKESEKALAYESSENAFASDLEIAAKMMAKKKMANSERGTWSSGLDFFMSSLGYAVGIGNVWRFPYLCYKNGGGAYLIPYFTCMILLGMPMTYLEFVVGQFTSCGPLTSFKMVRITRGVGLSINIANFMFCMFFQMVIAYAVYFFALSFTTELPWAKCNPEWKSPNCVDDYSEDVFTFNACENSTSMLKCSDIGSQNYGRCFDLKTIDGSELASCSMNASKLNQIGFWKTSFPSADYWDKMILQKTDSIEESGTIVWQLALSLFAVYCMTYFMSIKGVKVSGKAMYFTALFPYFVLLILGIRAWMLPGAADGLRFYLTPDWSRVFDIRVWCEAAGAIFFSISISFGGMTTLASYNKFNANIMQTAVAIPLANCLTSFFAGFVVFSYMGYLSHITGQDISNIIESGQGLAYVVYPYAVTTMTGGPIWSVMFFVMLILLGVSSSVATIEVTTASICDAFHTLSSTKRRKYITTTAIFVIYFLLGLLFCLQSGTYWLEWFNSYTGDWAILLVGASECIIVCYFYGLKNFLIDINVMKADKNVGKEIYVWSFLWSIVSPALCIFVAIYSLTKLTNAKMGHYVFPDWTLYFGQFAQGMMIFALFASAGFSFIYALINKKSISKLFKPDFKAYVPKLEENRKLVRIARGLETEEDSSNNLTFSSAEDMEKYSAPF